MTTKNKSIRVAVLPFQMNWEDHRIEGLFEGFTEDLIMNMSKFVGLSMISSYSTLQIRDFKDRHEIDRLEADFLVFGTVRKNQDKMRISIQLVRASDRQLVFGGTHDLVLESLVETLDGIIQQLVTVLQEKIDYNLLSHSYKKETVDLLAYENYLLGMHELKKGSAASDEKARVYFNQALEEDPYYSLAYTGLSLSYFNFWSCILWERWDRSMQGSKKYALKAIELDPNDYTALGILGRVYVYQGEYELAENCLRKSLRMNSNDTSHLLRVSFTLVLLGYADESVELYERAVRLNPFHRDIYYAYGASYYLQAGDFKKSVELAKKAPVLSWTDFPAWVAASYLQLNDKDNCHKYWAIYVKRFEEIVYVTSKDWKTSSVEEASMNWLMELNPFNVDNYLEILVTYMRAEKGYIEKKEMDVAGVENDLPENAPNPVENRFELKESVWELTYLAKKTVLKDAKGMHDLARMLEDPNREFHCLDLMGSRITEATRTDLIDHKARDQYMKRVRDLQVAIEDAEDLNQLESVERLRAEYDNLITHLSESMGLAGKSRKAGSSLEKARSAVTWRIRSSIKKIAQVHPELGSHLSLSVKTGTFCKYVPERETCWEVMS